MMLEAIALRGGVLAEGSGPLGLLFAMIPIGVLIGSMLWGFRIASRRVENIALQMLLGGLIGTGILIGAICVVFGIAFVGCMITGAPSFH